MKLSVLKNFLALASVFCISVALSGCKPAAETPAAGDAPAAETPAAEEGAETPAADDPAAESEGSTATE